MAMKDGSRRIDLPDGALLIDPTRVEDSLLERVGDSLFEPPYWAARGELIPADRGRGSAWFVGPPPHRWVLRHYRRGGAAARLSSDSYVWLGEARVRAFAEYRLLAVLNRRDLPVPAPIGARYRRSGFTYRCDLITQRIETARPMSALLADGALSEATWRADRRRGRLPAPRGRRSSGSQRAQRVDRLRRLRARHRLRSRPRCASPARGVSAISSACGGRSQR